MGSHGLAQQRLVLDQKDSHLLPQIQPKAYNSLNDAGSINADCYDPHFSGQPSFSQPFWQASGFLGNMGC
jgi:hypothetical protein